MTYKGARFRKADLQLHSPRDAAWQGGRPDETLGTTNIELINAARRQWASNFIDSCISKGIQVASLTDHHEGIYCWHVIDEINSRNGGSATPLDFWFMPGIELTCKDSAQALILFDSTITKSLFEKARNLLRLPTDCKEELPKGIEVELLDFNIEEIQSVLESDAELKGRFIVLPNVTPGGHKTVLRVGFHKRFKELPYVGGYLDKKYPHELEPGSLRILQGEIPAWTSERLGIISTSDARTTDFEDVGRSATWIKLTEPSAESLRQAMLAADSRIQYNIPQNPELFINSIRVSGAEFLLLDTPLHLSQQLTAVIGGRGSGKSTLLEFLRFALGQSALDTKSDWDPTHDRRRSILESALNASEGIVEVTITKDGAVIHLTRARASKDRITMRIDGDEKFISPDDAKKLFPIQAYSQGELSHLGDEKAESRLFELITEPNREAFNKLDSDLRTVASELREHLEQTIKLWQLEGQKRKLDAEITTIEAGIASAKSRLTDLPQTTQDIIDKHSVFTSTSSWIEHLNQSYKRAHSNLQTALEEFSQLRHSLLLPESIPVAEETQHIAVSLIKHLDNLDKISVQVSTSHETFISNKTEATTKYSKLVEEHNVAYQQAIAQTTQFQSEFLSLKKLEGQLATIQTSRENLIEKITPLLDLPTALNSKGGSYLSLQNQLRDLSQLSAEKLADLTDGLARAELYEVDDLAELYDAIKHLFARTGVRAERLENLENHIRERGPLTEWWNLVTDLLIVLRWKTNGLRETAQRPRLSVLDDIIDTGGLERFCELLDSERVARALTVIAKPRIRLLQKRGEIEIEFNLASQGEKATILLNVLMRQEGGPLLLDQPEEDLDNKIIGDIVTATRQAKSAKQLIFATHNANLVVNGDAELVVDLSNGRVNQIGSIDLGLVRDSITDTMEGGKDAFELRRKKYNF